MATIIEDYVSYETAKLLKEKGFNGQYHKYYIEDGKYRCDDLNDIKDYAKSIVQFDYLHKTKVIAPTLQMAMKWLREVHKLYINVCPCVEGYYWTEKWHSYVENLKKRYPFGTFICTLNSPEEACEAAIKYCLENLIS